MKKVVRGCLMVVLALSLTAMVSHTNPAATMEVQAQGERGVVLGEIAMTRALAATTVEVEPMRLSADSQGRSAATGESVVRVLPFVPEERPNAVRIVPIDPIEAPPEVVEREVVGYVALTFDDGPNRTYTVAILDAMKERDVVGTFFVLGNLVNRNPDVVLRMYEEGHQIGNHSMSHPFLTRLGRQGVMNELSATSDAIERVTGQRPTIFRPPYGARSSVTDDVARELGMSVIIWDVDPRDWEFRHAPTVYNSVMANVQCGSIILLHDVRQSTVDATIRIIDSLLERGYALVTVDELFEQRERDLVSGRVYSSARAG